MKKRFLVLQPGCDVYAADVFQVESDADDAALRYVVERGVPLEFLREAEIGDTCMFDRERVIIRIGRTFVGEEWT